MFARDVAHSDGALAQLEQVFGTDHHSYLLFSAQEKVIYMNVSVYSLPLNKAYVFICRVNKVKVYFSALDHYVMPCFRI